MVAINNRNRIEHSELLELLDYNQDTGYFIWRKYVTSRAIKGKKAGCVSKSNGYYEIAIKKKCYKASRLAWFYMTGIWPELQIDHIDQNKLNNSWRNLRLATNSQNQMNRKRIPRKFPSLPKGVIYSENNYYSYCMGNYLGKFNTADDASKAYNEYAKIAHGEFYYE